MDRRTFLGVSAGMIAAGCVTQHCKEKCVDVPFRISLAQWSLHRTFFGGDGYEKEDPLDFAKISREEFDIGGLEYVNTFYPKAKSDEGYVAELKKRADDHGVKSLLIMIDDEGELGNPDKKDRIKAVENHYKWADCAKELGCHSIRVNAASEGSYDETMLLAADGLSRLATYGKSLGLNVIVENHGGYSSRGKWLAKVMETVGMPNCGTLPDFGNFPEDEDRYEAVRLLMPYAKAVSAKTYDFDEAGNETLIDYGKMMKIVLDSGYNGYVGVEYEGDRLSERDGIRATKDLLVKIQELYRA